MDVYVASKRIRLDPSRSVGKGGEADVFDIGNGAALKVFKDRTHPDLLGQPDAQRAAADRIAVHQRKLPILLRQRASLPNRVVMPVQLATDASGKRVVGYTMPLIERAEVLLRYGQRPFRQQGVKNDDVIRIFRDLHPSVRAVHGGGFVIGDFNDLNVLVRGTEAYLIDADSFQFGQFLCPMFTQKFVDPTLCDPAATALALVRPYTADSDWYAFAVMLMQCLLFVDPYGGVFEPKVKTHRLPHALRPLKRVTVFHKEVRYPKPAAHFRVLPDDLLQRFHRIFEKDERGEFPLGLLETIRWTTCMQCGTEHARAICPTCSQTTPAMVHEVTTVRGAVHATQIFRTRGAILHATVEHGRIRWLFHERGAFRREDGNPILRGDVLPGMRFRLQGAMTHAGRGGTIVTVAADGSASTRSCDTFGSQPMFGTNGTTLFWLHHGQLLQEGTFGPEFIGDVLAGQTLFWVGNAFGFGFYRAGSMTVAFTFRADRRGINDSVVIPPFSGQLVDVTCVLAGERCWFFTAVQDAGLTKHRCLLVGPSGVVIASADGTSGDGSWLGTIRGKCAAGNFLLAATDEGLIRVEASGGSIVPVKAFPDTEPFVHAGCHLLAGQDGVYVVDRQTITRLQIAAP